MQINYKFIVITIFISALVWSVAPSLEGNIRALGVHAQEFFVPEVPVEAPIFDAPIVDIGGDAGIVVPSVGDGGGDIVTPTVDISPIVDVGGDAGTPASTDFIVVDVGGDAGTIPVIETDTPMMIVDVGGDAGTLVDTTATIVDVGGDAGTPPVIVTPPGNEPFIPVIPVDPIAPPVIEPPIIIPLPVPVCTLNASPASVPFGGGAALLSWSSSAATSASLDNGVGSVVPVDAGFQLVTVTASTLYTMIVSGPGGATNCSALVTVAPPPAAPTCTLSASPSSVQVGDPTTLTWTTTGATSFTIDNGVGAVAANGSRAVTPANTTTYTGTATGAGGTVTCAAAVTVIVPPPAPTCTLSVSPNTVQAGNPATLSWTTTNATSFSINPLGAVAIGAGSRVVTPPNDVTYTGTATGAGGTVTCAVSLTVTPVPPPPNAPTCVLSASPTSIQAGDTTTLSWTTTNATSFSINNGVGAATPVAGGSRSVSPVVNTTYTGTVSGPGGVATCSVAVTVTVAPPAPTCTLASAPASITAGGSSVLSWVTTNATSFSVDQGVGSMTPVVSGSRTVSPAVTTTYTGTATGAGGTITCATAVTVVPAAIPGCTDPAALNYNPAATQDDGSCTYPPAPTCAINATPTSIQNGSATTLTWSSTNATSMTISAGVGAVALNSSRSVSPTANTTYTATATGPGGTITCAVAVTVTTPPPPAPTCTLTATPASIQNGNASTLTWTTTNATGFSINNGVGAVTPVANGSRSVSPATTTTYTGTATGAGGTITCADTVTVTTTPPPPTAPTCTLIASSTSITAGGSSTLTWTTTNATGLSIDNAIGAVTPVANGSRSVSPATTTTYTATVTGSGGTSTCAAAITVTTLPPVGPACTLTANPSSVGNGNPTTLTWTTTNATSFSLDNSIGAVTPVAGGSQSVTPAGNTTYTGTATGPNGTATCAAVVNVTTGGCTSGCGGGGGGGGGGGSSSPRVSLFARPGVQSLIFLSQIPQTGLELGPIGTALYWTALIGWALALAYLVLFGAVPLASRSAQGFGARVKESFRTARASLPVAHIRVEHEPAHHAPVAHAAATPPRAAYTPGAVHKHETHHESAHEVVTPSAQYSSYHGFKSFAQNGALSIDDIVKGLARHNAKHGSGAGYAAQSETHESEARHEVAPHAHTEPVYEKVEPIYDHVQPIAEHAVEETHVSTPEVPAPAHIRGFVAALLEGDRAAVFAGLRQQVRGGGSPEQLLSSVVCLVDDVYRARVDGTPCDTELARLTARIDTPTLERLVASLTTAIDSSYSADVTGAKLALTRALATLGA